VTNSTRNGIIPSLPECRREAVILGRRLTAQIAAIKELARRGADIGFKAWAGARHDGLDASPRRIAAVGGPRFDEMVRGLQALRGTLMPGGPATSGALLGLPLEEDQEARRKEERERQEARDRELEAWRVQRERREQEARERRRAETRAFVASMEASARAILGDEAGAAWAAERLPRADAGSDPEMTPEQMDSARWDLEVMRPPVAVYH
jgi:hypothetical protein